MKVTLDTNVVPLEPELAAAADGYSFTISSVTERERPGSLAELRPVGASVTPEIAVFGESRFDECVWAGDDDPLEQILSVISGGSFPKEGQRDNLTAAERNQLRDAMILAGHVRMGADILVTDDRRAFVKHGRREKLEAQFQTRIMTLSEFRVHVTSGGNQAI